MRKISHPDKVLFPKIEADKQEILNYYRDIADLMFPFMKQRPMEVERYPDGLKENGFLQQNAPAYYPNTIKRIEITRKNEKS